MDESALERYFDKFIANDNLRTEQEEVTEEKQEEVTEEKQEEVTVEKQEEVTEDEELFFKLLPDELLTLNMFTWDNTAESRTVYKSSPYSSRTLDYNSQNSSAGAAFAQASSSSQPQASAVNPMTLAVPEILKEELPKPTLVLRSVLSTVNLGCHLDLDSIARNMWNVEYNPKGFKGLIMRNRDPIATVIMYPSGKMVCFVKESIMMAHLMARKYARKLQKFGFPVRFLNFKIQNLMATCKAFPVNCKKLCKICNLECSYDPKKFTGLFYEGIPRITVTVFRTGNINLRGAKSPDQFDAPFEAILSFMRQCRKQRRQCRKQRRQCRKQRRQTRAPMKSQTALTNK